jgi:hypothetical protein
MTQVTRKITADQIRFTQEWPTVTYYTERGYGIDQNPQIYGPLQDLLDQGYQPFATVECDAQQEVYRIQVTFAVPGPIQTLHCLRYPQATFRS